MTISANSGPVHKTHSALRPEVADVLDMNLEDVVLHNQYLGGGFGRRAFPDYTIQAARLATEVHYPVKLIWSREEDMRHDHYRQASISRFQAALDGAGKPTAWVNQYVEKHDPKEAPYIPYGIDNQLIHFAESQTHVPWGIWRSVDHSLHAFFTESFIDELAFEAGQDPYQYRRDLLENTPRFQNVLDLAAEKSGWDTPLPGNWGRGIAIHRSFGTIVAHVVEVEVTAGKVRPRRAICAVDAGFAHAPGRHESANGKRHRLRSDRSVIQRHHDTSWRRCTEQLPRLPDVAYERVTGH